MTSDSLGVAAVTGASGFVGRVLCDQLQDRGTTVRAVTRRPADGPWDELVTAEISGGELAPSTFEGADAVFHLAAKTHGETSVSDDHEHRAVTVDGTRRVLEAAQRAGVSRLVFMSTVKAAGEGGETLVDEGFEGPPQTAYGRAKREAETLVFRLAAESGMHATVLRPALVYGPGWKGNLARMFHAVQTGRFPPLPDTGNRRSMVHVADVAAAAVLAAGRDEANGRVYILCDGQHYSTRRIYEAMCQVLGRPVPRWNVPLPLLRAAARTGDRVGRNGRWAVPFDSGTFDRLLGSAWYDSGRARRELRWESLRTFEQSLPEIAATGARSTEPVAGTAT